MSANSLQEKFLIYKVRQNKDAEAYGKLYDYYVDRIYRFVYFKINSQEDAEDITSEVFLKAWEYINTTNKKIENFNALIYRVARNSVIDYYRNRKINVSTDDEENLIQIQDKVNVAENVDQVLDRTNIEKLLSNLKETYRDVILLRFIEDYSIAEISEITGKSKANVRVLLHRGIQALKEISEG
jgi:RNA polymerase sigma-70 factor, ECF subfamily